MSFDNVPPLYIGDALISTSPSQPSKTISIPGWDNINARLPSEAWGYVSGLEQKLNILNDGLLIVGWAGSRLQARVALRDI
jgi:hypothetical protein